MTLVCGLIPLNGRHSHWFEPNAAANTLNTSIMIVETFNPAIVALGAAAFFAICVVLTLLTNEK